MGIACAPLCHCITFREQRGEEEAGKTDIHKQTDGGENEIMC